MPVGSIGWAVWLRHMIGLLDHLTVHLEEKYSLLNTWQQKKQKKTQVFIFFSFWLRYYFVSVRVPRP